ncbi:MAG TPA: DUF790 family protein [Polyangiaceae bacterium]|nr:DUF790 family protein [Polyangiaceae bacterium]
MQPVDGAWGVNYLRERDHAWLALLMGEYTRCCGLRQSELKQRLAEPLPVWAPKSKRAIAEHVLDRLTRGAQVSQLPPREARQVVFSLAARQGRQRAAVLSDAAAALHVDPSALDAALFADLTSERRVGELSPLLTPAALAEQANLSVVESLFARALELRILAPQHTGPLVRHARRSGLLCSVETLPAGGVQLHVSGPFSLFRLTRVYGRALASLVRRTLGAPGYEMSADCQLSPRGDPVTLTVRAGDPIAPGADPVHTETVAERAFAREFLRVARDWELVRDPEPVAAGCQLVFADFELWRREREAPHWLVEIVGFWTRDYLSEKLARLSSAGLDHVLLCVDMQRGCDDTERGAALPESAQVLPYRRKVDVRALLDRLG